MERKKGFEKRGERNGKEFRTRREDWTLKGGKKGEIE